jgi:predicted anti-sigma-YlaC factor YlaD
VGCERYREALSARLDGEEEPGGSASLDAHLRGCAACRRWLADARAVTRLTRLQPMPAGSFTEVRLPRRMPRLSKVLRVILAMFGMAQFVLGILQVAGVSSTGHVHGPATLGGTVTSGHLLDESAAWNVAVGAGFAWIAGRRGRPAGALPMLTAFVGLLTLLSVNDLLAGHADVTGLVSHGFVLAGYGIVLALSRPLLDPGVPPPHRRGLPWRWKAQLDDVLDPPTPRLRLVPGGPTALHDDQRKAA